MGATRRKGNKPATNQRSAGRTTTEGYFSAQWRIAKGAFRALWVKPLGNILTLAVISIVLTMPACLYLLGKNLAFATQDVTAPVQVSVYLSSGLPEARVMVLKDQIERDQNVAGVEYISPQQGLQDLSEYSGFQQAISLLNDDALPGVLLITPQANQEVETQALAERVSRLEGVTDVRLDKDWLARLDAIQTLASIVVVILTVLMLGAVFLIIGNTLRFKVLENKEEIQTMKLIGATDSFILRPYLYSGMWFGFLASVCAWSLVALMTVILNQAVSDLASLYDSQYRLLGMTWDESLLLIMVGTLLGCVAARLSAQRHLKEIEPI